MKVCMYTKAPLSGGVTVKKAPETTQFRCSHECGNVDNVDHRSMNIHKLANSIHHLTKTALQNRFHCRSLSNEVNQTRLCKSAIQVTQVGRKWGIILCHQWHNHKSEMCWLFEISWKRKFHHLLLVTTLSNEVSQDFSS